MSNAYLNIFKHHIFRRHLFGLRQRFFPKPISDAEFFKQFPFETTTAETFLPLFARQVRYNFFFNLANRKEFFLQLLTRLHSHTDIVMDAEAILNNKIELFGITHRFSDDWNWHLDLNTQQTFNKNSFYTTISLPANGQDVKFAWDLSRFHFTWTLGKAYWTTNRRDYKEKFLTLALDWIKQNPFCYGVNWMSPMDVAIRAANWIAGFYFFNDDKPTETETTAWITILKSLWQHGIYLEHNLEYTRRSGNHLLADAVGLLMLGVFFKASEHGRMWLELGKNILEEEILSQTYPDGVNYEMSVAYHRMVTEFFLTAFVLMNINKQPFSLAYRDRLVRMLHYLAHYTKPDGTAPLLGDSDDGRLFWFRNDEDFNNHTSVLSIAQTLFDFPFTSLDIDFSEQALWLLGTDGWELFQRKKRLAPTTSLTSTLFPDSQIAIMRQSDTHIFIDAGELGKKGWGGHGNNDTLSFELYANSVNWLTDRGTFTYTANKDLRNELRSTRSHNTVMIDGVELADFANAFKVKDDFTNPKILKWETSSERDVLIVEHSAYARLSKPVKHQREFFFDKQRSELLLTDTLTGQGEHTAEFFFHFAPDIVLAQNGNIITATHVSSAQLVLTFSAKHKEIAIQPSWIAPRYHRRVETQMLAVRIAFQDALVASVRFSWQSTSSDTSN
ncbi:MAG: alginate lyase family protein [Chloroherpetonaceae bacterium]